jgi:hypothetical protein
VNLEIAAVKKVEAAEDRIAAAFRALAGGL